MVENGTADDPSIPDDAELWRRIPPWHFYQLAHAVVLGRKTDSIKRRFAREARWVVLPPVS
jgi:hypothetical protein